MQTNGDFINSSQCSHASGSPDLSFSSKRDDLIIIQQAKHLLLVCTAHIDGAMIVVVLSAPVITS